MPCAWTGYQEESFPSPILIEVQTKVQNPAYQTSDQTFHGNIFWPQTLVMNLERQRIVFSSLPKLSAKLFASKLE
jgi:uncharacterized NAD-dependent epimerase/dehydratase family protein